MTAEVQEKPDEWFECTAHDTLFSSRQGVCLVCAEHWELLEPDDERIPDVGT